VGKFSCRSGKKDLPILGDLRKKSRMINKNKERGGKYGKDSARKRKKKKPRDNIREQRRNGTQGGVNGGRVLCLMREVTLGVACLGAQTIGGASRQKRLEVH